MATKGVKIDVNRLEDYETGHGHEVLFLAYGTNKRFPLYCVYRDNDGDLLSSSYTEDGFWRGDKITSEEDLVLQKSEVKAEEKPAKKRKVVQISAVVIGEDNGIYALCDDGKIFYNWNSIEWYALPEIPQD